jgi:hypothetical protein
LERRAALVGDLIHRRHGPTKECLPWYDDSKTYFYETIQSFSIEITVRDCPWTLGQHSKQCLVDFVHGCQSYHAYRSGTTKDHDFVTNARRVVEQAIGEHLDGTPLEDPNAGKNPATVALGRIGGKKGGMARAKALSTDQRRTIAKAALARWKWSVDGSTEAPQSAHPRVPAGSHKAPSWGERSGNFMYYNFVRIHQTLRVTRQWPLASPASCGAFTIS